MRSVVEGKFDVEIVAVGEVADPSTAFGGPPPRRYAAGRILSQICTTTLPTWEPESRWR
jgi:hypothetical protein